ncbi:ribulose 1,5-bisphosphate carboxylase small subunit [Calothrix parasitica NIES-267]|uniref:Ribulose 1,5-bisphosphate carboxylase small subunit n=1 Tax=Calothrix parasitica NIES-267 TaxID=1973488 RepID=A0A1Z4LP69_9CYAN|nr:ribulose 1,5-bisphosphate carboxylase small subunit [Calothrix parasitica NIES-267]
MSYYISSRFEDKLAVHITKNYLDLPNVRVPLILGIHGRKGEGKSFQCELVFKKMGVEVTHISGGELESPDAGDPARLIRLRYRETAELIKVRGKMCVLMINDLDAGAGRFDEGTQYTVNTQLVNATLMNIADNPTDVQLPGSYDSTPLHRVPIIVTGNDFSTLYAPLVRDGRMEKFYWEPDRDDKVGIVGGIFSEDGFSKQDVAQLVDTFPLAAVDFYSALRSRIYDEQIRHFIHDKGVDQVSSQVVNSNNVPSFRKPNFGLSDLMTMANLMVEEQHRVDDSQLVEEYNKGALRHQKYFVPQTSQTGVYEARPTSHFDADLPVYQARPTANFDETLPTYHARPSHQTQAEAVHIPDIPTGQLGTGRNRSVGQNPNRGIYDMSLASTHVGPEILSYMQKILASGNHLSIDYSDNGKSGWKKFSTHEIDDMADAIGDLERCLVKHTDDYVRVAGIDYKTKQAVMETIIQDPNETNGSTFHYPPTQTLYPSKQISENSTFRYPESKLDSHKQIGGSTFRYPETVTPNYKKQSSDSSFQYPETSKQIGGSTFHYPETSTPNYSEQSSDSTFHYPETSKQIGGSTFRYPETSTPHYSEQSSDSTFHYPETSKQIGGSTFRYPETSTVNDGIGGSTFRYPETAKTYNNVQSSDSTFQYPDSDPFPHTHTAAHSPTATSNPNQVGSNYHTYGASNANNAQISSAHLQLEVLEQMREILATGAHIGIEYVDQRRFSTGSWKSYAGHQIEDMAEAIAALEACLVEHNNDYIRIFGIDPQAKRRLAEIMVQRPAGKLAIK